MDGAGSGGKFRSAIRRETAIAAARATGRPLSPSDLAGPAEPEAVLGDRADLYNSMGAGYIRAFELAVTPVVFGALGYGLDRWVGLVPVFTIVFVLVAVVGMMLRTWYGYVARMQELESAGPWARGDGKSA